jgi:hypothetical protein
MRKKINSSNDSTTADSSSSRENELKQRKEKWREEKIAQYKTYKYPQLRALVSLYYNAQGERLANDNRARELEEIQVLPPDAAEASKRGSEKRKEAEKDMEKLIKKYVSEIPIYREYLSEIKGLGPILSGCLIAYLQDIGRFNTISALHRYSGLSAIDGKAQKRRAGWSTDYDPKMKTLMWKIGKSFLTSRNPEYRKIYDDAHRHYEERGKWSENNPTGNKNKAHTMNRSLIKMERIFLANVWLKWRQLEGLPVSDPYIFAIGGHAKEHMIVM